MSRTKLQSRANYLLLIALLLACQDERRNAVDNIVAFAGEAPFTIAAPKDQYSGYLIVVRESARESYDRIFRYYRITNRSRANTYRLFPEWFFKSMPITKVEAILYQEAGDTLRATVAYERPLADNFTDRFESILSSDDTLPPTPEKILEFERAVGRIRQEPLERDTAFIWVVKGPRVVRTVTASAIRDSIARASLIRVARENLKRVVETARVNVDEVKDYSSVGLGTAGAVRGMVYPGAAGWYKNERVVLGYLVQCEARRDSAVTVEEGYVAFNTGSHTPDDFLCLWVNDMASEWIRIKPVSVRVRLVAHLGSDSIYGAWVTAR